MKATLAIDKLHFMKIRWNKNSVRLRITPSELETLQRHESVSETLEFGNGYWQASISVYDSPTRLWLEKMMLHIHLSQADLSRLAAPENEGVYFSTGDVKPIKYFIEKDFPCAHPRASEAQEPVSETFIPTPDFERRKEHIEPEA